MNEEASSRRRHPCWTGRPPETPRGRAARERAVRPNQEPDNNALERTRRGGVPATRAVVGVSPCRSMRCYPGFSGGSRRRR